MLKNVASLPSLISKVKSDIPALLPHLISDMPIYSKKKFTKWDVSRGGVELSQVCDADEEVFNTLVAASSDCVRRYDYCPTRMHETLSKTADIMTAKAEELAVLSSLDNGVCVTENMNFNVKASIDVIRFYAGFVKERSFKTRVDLSEEEHRHLYCAEKPHGICLNIASYNYPLHSLCLVIGGCIGSGNVLIHKASPASPLTSNFMFQILQEAGLDKGLFSVVHSDDGNRFNIVEKLIDGRHVDHVTFTGSTGTAQHIATLCGANLIPTNLEGGGKNSIILNSDISLSDGVENVINGNFVNNGAVCSNCTVAYVHSDIIDEFTDELIKSTRSLITDDPLSPKTDIGSVIQHPDRLKQYNYIMQFCKEHEKHDDVELLYDGPLQYKSGAGDGDGDERSVLPFITPKIYKCDIHSKTALLTEDIFGPVLTIVEFEDVDLVMDKINNSTPHGLACGIMTSDAELIEKVTSEAKTGVVYVNKCYNEQPVEMGFGGCGMTGGGVLGGVEGWERYNRKMRVLGQG